jgi:TonB family protein
MKMNPALPVLDAAKWTATLLAAMIGSTFTTFAQAQPTTTPEASAAVTKKTIEAVQERLQALGYQAGLADGVQGAKTIVALKKFQLDHGLSASGAIDRRTLDALDARPEDAAAKPTKPLAQAAAEKAEKYHILTPDDGLSCAISQDLSVSMDPASLSGNVTATGIHLSFADKEGREVSPESKSVEAVDGKWGIKTKEFGTILTGAFLDNCEMTESQITGVKTFIAAQAKAGPVRIARDFQAAKLVHRVEPDYPPLAKQARIGGVVELAVLIAKDGSVQHIEVLRGRPMLVRPAIDAVSHWLYKPTLIDGKPVEVATTVDVPFVLGQR